MAILGQFQGVVVHGDARGRELGFPTANVAVEDAHALLPIGIYAGWLRRSGGERLPSAVSIGKRPTFYADAPRSLVEVHVLDWSGDLYGEQVCVEIVARLRDESRFDTADSLIRQMNADCATARTLLAQGNS